MLQVRWPGALSLLAICSEGLGLWQDESETLRIARVRASRIEERLKKIADRVDASRQLVAILEPAVSRADEELALVESLRRNGKSQRAAIKEASAAMEAKDDANAGTCASNKTSKATHKALSNQTVPSVPGDITSQRALLDQTRTDFSKRNARLHRIERRLSQLRKTVSEQKRLSSFAGSVFDARLAAWTDTTAAAGSCRVDPADQTDSALLESGAAAAICTDLRSARTDVDVVVHLGTPFSGPETLAAVRSALAVSGTAVANSMSVVRTVRITAANVAREAIRQAWTQPTARAALSHGSHLLVASLSSGISIDIGSRQNSRETFEAAQVHHSPA